MVHGHCRCYLSPQMCRDLLTSGHTSKKLPSAQSCQMIKKEHFWLFATSKHQRLWEYRTTCTLCSLYLPWPWNSVQSSTSSDQTVATGGVSHSAESLAWKNPAATYHQRVKYSLVYPNLTVINFNFQITSAHKHCAKVRSNTDASQHNISKQQSIHSISDNVFAEHCTRLLGSLQKERMSSKEKPS